MRKGAFEKTASFTWKTSQQDKKQNHCGFLSKQKISGKSNSFSNNNMVLFLSKFSGPGGI
jgi:hypothetical protein